MVTLRRRSVLMACLFGLAIVYAWIAAGTKPFTVAADVVTAVPLLLVAVAAVAVRWRRSRTVGTPPPSGEELLWPWWALVAAVAIIEIVAYVGGLGPHRYAYPTISSIYDEVSTVRALKAALFLGWLAVGWVIVCQ